MPLQAPGPEIATALPVGVATMEKRYEGDISGQDSAHALTAGVRMTW